MIVNIIKEDGKTYQTVAFAVIYNEWKTEWFVLNENGNFERVFGIRQNTKYIIPQIMIVDNHKFEDGWLKEEKCEGYKEFIHNPKLLDRIRNGESDLFDYLTQIGWDSMQGSVGTDVNYGPIEIADSNDIDNFIDFTGSCHDGTIRNIEWNKDKTEVTLTLEGVWGLQSLRLTFKRDIEIFLEEDYEYNYLFGCSVFFENGKVCFVGDEGFSSISEAYGITYISAREMFYSFEYGKSKDDLRGDPEIL